MTPAEQISATADSALGVSVVLQRTLDGMGLPDEVKIAALKTAAANLENAIAVHAMAAVVFQALKK